MLQVYRQLAGLRRRLPQLTDPAFERTRCTADEETRLFTMRRGEVVVVVNFGTEPVTTDVGDGLALLFETESGVDLAGASLTLPGHAGALLAPTV
jgi:maltooligosyltrehalose trehalohydrolase